MNSLYIHKRWTLTFNNSQKHLKLWKNNKQNLKFIRLMILKIHILVSDLEIMNFGPEYCGNLKRNISKNKTKQELQENSNSKPEINENKEHEQTQNANAHTHTHTRRCLNV